MFNKLFSGRVPEQEEIDDLRAEIEEARRIHDYTQAKKLQRKLQKIERRPREALSGRTRRAGSSPSTPCPRAASCAATPGITSAPSRWMT